MGAAVACMQRPEQVVQIWCTNVDQHVGLPVGSGAVMGAGFVCMQGVVRAIWASANPAARHTDLPRATLCAAMKTAIACISHSMIPCAVMENANTRVLSSWQKVQTLRAGHDDYHAKQHADPLQVTSWPDLVTVIERVQRSIQLFQTKWFLFGNQHVCSPMLTSCAGTGTAIARVHR